MSSTVSILDHKSLSLSYVYDDDIKLKEERVILQTGQVVHLGTITSGIQDGVATGYNSIILTDRKFVSDCIEIKTPTTSGDLPYITTLVIGTSAMFWDGNGVFYESVDLFEDEKYFFKVLPTGDIDDTCYILTSPLTSPGQYIYYNNGVFEFTNDPLIADKFVTIHNPDNNTTRFFSITNPSTPTLAIDGSGGLILTTTLFESEDTVFTVRTKPYTSERLLDTKWVTYTNNPFNNISDINHNLLTVVTPNQFLLLTNYNSCLTSYNVDILSLKNYETHTGFFSYSNPYTYKPIQKQYTTIDINDVYEDFDGTLSLNYISPTYDIHVIPDAYTSFVVPPISTDNIIYNTDTHTLDNIDLHYNLNGESNISSLFPFIQLNVNDAMLGYTELIAGTAPIYSDKIFTQMSERRGYEQSGQYICTWLSAGSSPDMLPIWVDRYYNPALTTEFVALTSVTQNLQYTPGVETLAGNITPFFDKSSDIVFVPGQKYTIYHIGNDYINSVIEQQDITEVSLKTKIFNINSRANRSISIPELTFDGESYLSTIPIDLEKNNLTIQFDLDSSDWYKRFGHMVIGNFTDRGLGIFNETKITPFYVFSNENTLYVYNLNHEIITSSTFNTKILTVVRTDYQGSIYVVLDDTSVYRMTLTGNKFDAAVNVTQYAKLEKIEEKIQSIFINDNFTYLSISGLGVVGILNMSTSEIRLQSVTGNYLQTAQGEPIKVYSPITDDVIYLGYESGEDDVFGTYFVYDNQTYTIPGKLPKIVDKNNIMFLSMDNKTIFNVELLEDGGSNRTQFAHVTGDNIINDFNIDSDNNVIILKNRKVLIKMNLKKQLINIFNQDDVDSNFFIEKFDIVGEFTSSEYRCGIIAILSDQEDLTWVNRYDKSLIPIDNPTQIRDESRKAITYSDVGLTYDLTNYEYLRRKQVEIQGNTNNSLTFRCRLKNQFSIEDDFEFRTVVDITKLHPGSHTFTLTFNTETGEFRLYVDNVEVDAINFEPLRYVFNTTFSSMFFLIGATPFFNNTNLKELTKVSDFVCRGGNRISNIKFYNNAISSDIISFLGLRSHNFDVINITMPGGIRNFKEDISHFIRTSLPGTRSSDISVIVKNSNIRNTVTQKGISEAIEQECNNLLPINSSAKEIKFVN